jgi:uncharacterized membrane protein
VGKICSFFLLMAVVHTVTTLLEGVELLKVLKCIGKHETQTRHLNNTINYKYIFIHAIRLHQHTKGLKYVSATWCCIETGKFVVYVVYRTV